LHQTFDILIVTLAGIVQHGNACENRTVRPKNTEMLQLQNPADNAQHQWVGAILPLLEFDI
jgi:hypothetical protein